MDEDHDDGLGGRSRTRREVTEANRWGKALHALSDAQFAAAPLPPEVRAEADVSRRATSFRARDRAIMRVDALLRDMDDAEVAELDAFLADPPSLRQHPETAKWFDRLVSEGDGAVSELVAAYPGVPVQRLRQLVRNARKPDAPARSALALRGLLDEWFFS